MGQGDVIKVLRSKPNKWFRPKEIRATLKCSDAINKCLLSLRKYDEVYFRIIIDNKSFRKYEYKYKVL